MSTTLVICRGLPASGKTRWARAWVGGEETARARVNKDDLRRLLHDGVYLGRDTENTVNMIRDNTIRSLLRKEISVVSDDTNLPQAVARDLARIGRELGATIDVVDMTNVSAEVCIERDAAREHSVGEEVIRGMAAKLGGKGYPLPLPEDPLGETPGVVGSALPYVRNPHLPGAWIVDIDGTLALKSDRSPYDWHRVGEDSLNPAVDIVARGLMRVGLEIVFASGRDSVCRPETEEWLDRFGYGSHALYMRPEGDMRKDSIVKRELLSEISKVWSVVGVLDDRPSVCRMWREVGLPVLQVGDPHVEF